MDCFNLEGMVAVNCFKSSAYISREIKLRGVFVIPFMFTPILIFIYIHP